MDLTKILKGKRYIEVNKNATYQNMRDATEAVLRWKIIALNISIKEEKLHVNNQVSNSRN